MRLLVLGGTIFVGHAVASAALARGHDVVCAARGESGDVPDGATLTRVDRDAEDGLAPLAGERFDAVVDVAPLSFPWVERALRAFAETAAHWTFVSTINVYADETTLGLTPATGTLRTPRREHSTREEMMARGEEGVDLYGGIKVASENAVLDALAEHAFVVRPGLVTGAGDRSDRFGYWPARFARGGRVLVPAPAEDLTQYIDVRDLASWIVDAGEQHIAGVYDAIGPSQPLADLLAGIAAAVGTDVEFVGATDDQLTAAGVNPWSGPHSLPLWVPGEAGHGAHDATPSIEAGMPVRPLAEAVADALARERELGIDRARKAGLTPKEESEVLASLER